MRPRLRGWLVALSIALWPWLIGAGEQQVGASLLVFHVVDPGAEPYLSRVLVTARFLRMDQGGEAGDGFVLLERGRGIIYSVLPDEGSILVLDPPREKPAAPLALELADEPTTQEGAPAIQGVSPKGLRLLANGRICREAVVLPGLMSEAVTALREYYAVLASQHAQTLGGQVSAGPDACDLATHVYAPARALEHGLPLRVWEPGGWSQQLVDFAANYLVDPGWFELPEGFERRTLGEMMGGVSR